ncbi:MAG: hypothetical protein D6705_02385 [Deltaproteobacteria bacterium]|nr:MAG: hypothetical protein D6705_02385 [Deltaproteobacteria bacterium]
MTDLERRLSHLRRRARVARTLRWVHGAGLPAALAVAAVAAVLHRFAGAPAWCLAAAAVPVLGAILWGLLAPISLARVATAADRHFDLADALRIGLELSRHPPTSGRARVVAELAVARATDLAARLPLAEAIPLRPGAPGWLHAAGLGALLAAVAIPVPAPPTEADDSVQTESKAAIERTIALDLSAAAPLRDELRELAEGEDEVAALARRMLEILEALERGEMDRAAALAELERLEAEIAAALDELEKNLEEDPALLAEGIRRMVEALDGHGVARPLAEALERGDPEAAAAAAFDESMSPEEDRDLARALAEAARALADAEKTPSDTDAKLAEAERRLRRAKRKRPGESDEEHERRLRKAKRRVESLRRQKAREDAARRRLASLRRDTRSAARSRGAQRRSARSKMARGAGQAARTARRFRRLAQLSRDAEDAAGFVRRAGAKGAPKDRRGRQRQRFERRARGKKGDRKGKKGKPRSTLLVEGDVGDGTPDAILEGEGNESGESGEGNDDGAQGEGDGAQGGEGGEAPGDGMGHGTADPLGDPTRRPVALRDERANPRKGRGATRAEVIATSSQEGFASVPYREVFSDYHAFAQTALDGERIPEAKKRIVHRYFHLVRPR